MKYAVALVAAAFAGIANAQSACLATAEAIPSCGQACLTNAGSSYGCAYTDFACQCSHSSQINNAALTECILSACSSNINEALSVSSGANALCSCASANAGSGTSATATTTAAVPTSTAAITGGASSSAAATGGSSVTMQSAPAGGAGATSAVSMFTGGAAYTAGSIGGVMAGILGLIAAL